MVNYLILSCSNCNCKGVARSGFPSVFTRLYRFYTSSNSPSNFWL